AADEMIEVLKRGISIDQAFERAKFHHTITTYLYFVKDNGDVLSSIQKGTEMFENRLKHLKKFQDMIRYPLILFFIFSVDILSYLEISSDVSVYFQTLRYPLILFFIFSILLYFINGWVLPSFLDIFQSNPNASSMIYFSIMVIDYLVKISFILIILLII